VFPGSKNKSMPFLEAKMTRKLYWMKFRFSLITLPTASQKKKERKKEKKVCQVFITPWSSFKIES
jgi:hypothetical protein